MKTNIVLLTILILFLFTKCNFSKNDVVIREINLKKNDKTFIIKDSIALSPELFYLNKGDELFCYLDSTVRIIANELTREKRVNIQNDRFYLIKDTIYNYNDIQLNLMFINYDCGSDCCYLIYFSETYGLIKLFYNHISYEVLKLYYKKNNITVDIANLNNLIEKNGLLNTIPPPPDSL